MSAERFNPTGPEEKIGQPGWDETYTPENPEDERSDKNPAIDIDEPQRRDILTHRPFQYLEF